jgi:hypothetical protein
VEIEEMGQNGYEKELVPLPGEIGFVPLLGEKAGECVGCVQERASTAFF